jgi:glycosyltransferase involved in cell wall biosynthesis
MRILICGNTSNSILLFRKSLILELINKKHQVFVTCADSNRKTEIQNLGATFFEIKFNNRSLKFFKLIKLYKEYFNLMKRLELDIVFTYMLKPNLIGTLAAKNNNVNKIIALNEGKGDGFGSDSIIGHIIQAFSVYFHRISFKNIHHLIVLNSTDYKFFLKKKIVNENQISLIPGVGIDLERFHFNQFLPQEKNVLMVSRLIKSKGVLEFCNLAELTKKDDPMITFTLVGPEHELKYKDIKKFVEKGLINYLGQQNDVEPFIINSRIVVFPSYYNEGLPIATLESMAIGRCTISYKNPGSIDLIKNEVNGYLVDSRNLNALKRTILENIYNDDKLSKITIEARKEVDNKYSTKEINKEFIKILLVRS